MKVLICRVGGAFGDVVVATPLVRYLHEQGHEVHFMTGKPGAIILANNPHVEKILIHEENSVPSGELKTHFKKISKTMGCDKLIDLSGSIETKVILDPPQPQYNYPKEERRQVAEHNVYELMFDVAGIEEKPRNLLPEMFFTEEEEEWIMDARNAFLGRKLLLWVMGGSAAHKTYPYFKYVIEYLINKHDDLSVVTLGGKLERDLEKPLVGLPNVILKSGELKFRQSALLVKYASLIVGPETGLMHVSGCFDTPKIVLLGHTSVECFPKYFKNDYSEDAQTTCAPCFRFILNTGVQCPLDEFGAPMCMANGHDPDKLIEKMEGILWKLQIVQHAA